MLSGVPQLGSADEAEATTAGNTTGTTDTVNCEEQGEEEERKCGDPEPGEIPGGDLPSILAGNPINFLSGNKRQREIDFAIPGSRLTFKRTYNSVNPDNNVGLGQGWWHTYAVSLYSADGQLQVEQSNGSRLYFSEDVSDYDGLPTWRGNHSNEGFLVQTDEHRYDWHLPDGRTLSFQGSFLVRIEWPGYQYLKLFYRNRKLSEVTDETGRLLTLAYHPPNELVEYTESRFGAAAGHLSAVTLPDGRKISYDYDQSQNLTRTRFANETSREYHYEDSTYLNHLTGITDRTGARAATWRYDDSGRAISSERANGLQRLTIEYPDLQAVDAGKIVTSTLTSSLGKQSTYTWINPGHGQRSQLLSSTGVPCTTCPTTGYDYVYDDSGRLLSKTHNGQGSAIGVNDTRIVYDELGRVIERWISDEFAQERLSERREYEGQSVQPVRFYTPSVNPNAEQMTEIERDEQGLPVRITKRGFAPQPDASGVTNGFTPIENVTSIGYDAGRMVSVDGPREDVDDTAEFGWDEQNRMISMAMPDSPPMRITQFDTAGRAVTFIKGSEADSASPITLSYNDASQVTSVTQLGRTLSMRYDAEGRLTGVVNRVGREMALGYDDAGQLITIEYVGGQRMTTDYDDEGRVIGESLMDQYGGMIRSMSTLYDAQGRVASVSRAMTIAGVVGANSTVVDYEHDANNRAIRATEQTSAGHVELQYNAFGALAGMANNSGARIRLGYDAAGNNISLSDTRDNQTQFIQDDFGRVVAVVSPDVGTSRYTYDEAGNRLSWTNPDGKTTDYQWDAANRPLLISSNDGDTRFEYDPGTGALAQTSNNAGTERFKYDRNARLLRHERTIDKRSFVTEYQYDDQGRMQSRQLPDGQSLRYHYYKDGTFAGQLRAITRSKMFGLQQEVLLAEIDEDPSDGITGYIAHNGKRTTRSHASDGRVTRIEVSDTLTLDYRYDRNGQIIGIDENGFSQSYDYRNGYLSSANTLTGSYVFNYDQTGNRTSKVTTLPDGQQSTKHYQYAEQGAGNRLVAEGEDAATTLSEVIYNTSGSPVARGSLRYEYNNNQRPVKVFKDDALLAEYAYNSFGERIKKVTYSADLKHVTYFLYDGHRISAEISADDTESMAQTIYLNEQPVIQLVGNTSYAIHTDKLGTPHLLSDEAGTIAWQAEYSPFGKATVLIDDLVFNHRFLGQYEDTETGTHYNYQRDYDPETGRYLSSDPLSVMGGINTYLYANADPLNSVDVLGLKPDVSVLDNGSGQRHIIGEDYDELHRLASAGDGAAYFQLMFDLTNHGLYQDFADSYNNNLTLPSILILRDIFLLNGTAEIKHVQCMPDKTPIYLIPEIGVFSNLLFQRAQLGRVAGSFIVESGKGLWNLGVGLVNLAFDSTIGIQGDLQNLLADYYGVDSLRLPAWYPSYSDAVDTLDGLIDQGGDIAANIIVNHDLIWQDIKDEKVRQWAERRYTEAIAGPLLEIGSILLSGGLSAAAKVSRATDILIGLRRGDELKSGDFVEGIDELVDAFADNPNGLQEAADKAGLGPEVAARLAAANRVCSFAGDTLVITQSGYQQIQNITAGKDRVWAKDERSGQMGWQDVLAHYSNYYEETVDVTAVDNNGRSHTITSNLIHPYFARVSVEAVMATASIVPAPAKTTEGHVYAGDIDGGVWIDAQYLQPGDELLTDNNQWQTVKSVHVSDRPLEAYNITVDEYSTYFVAGDEGADAIWVHNKCPDDVTPAGLQAHNTEIGELGQRRQISGAHNMHSFDASVVATEALELSRVELAPGLWKVSYAVQKQDRAGNPIPGEYREKPADKTIYDPGVFPDAEIARMGSEAAASAVFLPGKQFVDVRVGARTFRVTRNVNTGVITNAFVIN